MRAGIESAGIDRWARAVVSGCEAALRSGEQGAILEALASVEALGAALELVGSGALATLRERPVLRSLRARGRLLLSPGRVVTRGLSSAAPSDAAVGERHAAAVAQAGLARLEGSARKPLVSGTSWSRVPEESMLRLVRGELDGFRAAELSWRLHRDADGAAELRLLLGPIFGEQPIREKVGDLGPLRLAAEGPSALRDPSTGALVGRTRAAVTTKHRVALEAVRFPDGVVAIYASHPVAIGLAPARKEAASAKKPASARNKPAIPTKSPVVLGSAPGYLELRERADGPLSLTVDGLRVVLDLSSPKRL